MSNQPFDMNDPYGLNAVEAAKAEARKVNADRTAQADAMLAAVATRTTLVWPIASGVSIQFDLLYSADGKFTAIVITSGGNRYPLARRGSSSGSGSGFEAQIHPARGAHDLALAIQLNLAGFRFEGYAMQFSSSVSGPAPQTVW